MAGGSRAGGSAVQGRIGEAPGSWMVFFLAGVDKWPCGVCHKWPKKKQQPQFSFSSGLVPSDQPQKGGSLTKHAKAKGFDRLTGGRKV